MRAPVIAGIHGGEGTTTLAAALHGRDAGRYAGGAVDVLVCRPGSLVRAAAVPGTPVLVMVADDAVADSARARMRDLGSRAIVLLPHVARWREGEPLVEARALLGLSADLRPRELGPYATALLAITAAVVRGGALHRPLPSSVPAVVVPPSTRRRTVSAPPEPGVPSIAGPRPGPPLRVVTPVPVIVAVPAVRRDPLPADRAPVLVRAATPPPQPVRLAPPVALRPVAGSPLRLRSTGPVTPVGVAAGPIGPGIVAPAGPAPVRVVPVTVLHPVAGMVAEPDDDALEAEPYHLRTG